MIIFILILNLKKNPSLFHQFSGTHSSIIVPPSWIVKLPRRGSFKSSLRKSPKKKNSSKKRSKEKVS